MRVYNGFSLIELTIVIALCAIIMGLGVACGSFMYRGVIKQEAEKLALICRYLQHAAMMSNELKVLAFDLKKRCYTYDGCSVTLSKQVDFGVLGGVKGPPADPSHEILEPISFKDGKIVFYPDGIIQPGAVYLIGKNEQIMYALSCPVSQISYIRIYKYDGSWQCVS
jgi:prepilin-type N-terminal cleavage/methylation domain-containing protein